MKENEIHEDELNNFLTILHMNFGYDFTGYAHSSLRRRLSRFATANHITSMAQLHAHMLGNKALAEELIRELSVTVTEMFRDPSFYKTLREKVIRRLATYPVIRIWVAGCATGEEAYSLAILLKEEGLLDRAVIYATDINPRSVETARQGILPLAAMKLYTSNYLEAGGTGDFSEYYMARYGSVLLDKSLKERIVFSTHNLASDTCFNEFQLITCRNVLIYFNHDLQNKVLGLFYESLCPFGFLGLGNRESLLFSDKKTFFDEVNRKERIYVKSGKH